MVLDIKFSRSGQGKLEELSFFDKASGYDLRIWEDSPEEAFKVYFEFPDRKSKYTNRNRVRVMKVSARDYLCYSKAFEPFSIEHNQTYLELGPGLGGFIPFVAESMKKNGGPKPVALDIANYDLMSEMLFAAQKKELSQDIHKKISTLLYRCNVIMDSNKVSLIQKNFSDVPKETSLRACADTIIEFFGPFHYARDSFDLSVITKEYLRGVCDHLLKKDGRIISPWG